MGDTGLGWDRCCGCGIDGDQFCDAARSASFDRRLVRVGRHESKNQFVADAMDRQQMFGCVAVVAEFFT